MGGADAAGDRGALARVARRRGRHARAASVRRRRPTGDVGGGEVGAGTVQACGVAPLAGGITGDIDADFHHQPGLDQRDVQSLPAAPSGGERPARPRMPAPPRLEQAGDRSTCRPGKGDGAADVLKAAGVVVPAEQQTGGSGQGAGDRTDDRLGRLAPYW